MIARRQTFAHLLFLPLLLTCIPLHADNTFPKPYSPPCVERENVFEFT